MVIEGGRIMDLKEYLEMVMKTKKLTKTQLSLELGVSHPNVGRWLSGEDAPGIQACVALSDCVGTPLLRVLKIAGHLPEDYPDGIAEKLPDFFEYMKVKFPKIPTRSVTGLFAIATDDELWGR